MALTTKNVFEARKAAQYTGSNSADLAAEIADFTVMGEDASNLTFASGGQQYTVARNGYVTWYNGQVSEVFQNQDDYADAYTEVDEALGLSHVHAITTGPGHLM